MRIRGLTVVELRGIVNTLGSTFGRNGSTRGITTRLAAGRPSLRFPFGKSKKGLGGKARGSVPLLGGLGRRKGSLLGAGAMGV